MERIRITPTTKYFLKGILGNTRTLMDLYELKIAHADGLSRDVSMYLHIKQNDEWVIYHNIDTYDINHRNILSFSEGEIEDFMALSDFTFTKKVCNGILDKSLNIDGTAIFEVGTDKNAFDYPECDSKYLQKVRLLELYMSIIDKGHGVYVVYVYYNDKRYLLDGVFINNKPLSDYTYQEVDEIERSRNYTIDISGGEIYKNVTYRMQGEAILIEPSLDKSLNEQTITRLIEHKEKMVPVMIRRHVDCLPKLVELISKLNASITIS